MRNKATIAGLAALAALAVACGSGGKDVTGPGDQGGAAKADDGKKKITLEVTGPKTADITFGITADQSQQQGAHLPWKKELTSAEAVIIPTVVAQSKGSGKISCKITIDGKVVKTNSSSGQYAVVTCTADNI